MAKKITKKERKRQRLIEATSRLQDRVMNELFTELVNMSVNCHEPMTTREVYLGRNQDRAREIGKQLNDLGGMYLMRSVADEIARVTKTRNSDGTPKDTWSDVRQLDYCWSGIGEWLC